MGHTVIVVVERQSQVTKGRNKVINKSMANINQAEKQSRIFKDAIKTAFKGGISGSIAQASNVVMFMWLRTAMTNQYKNGGSLKQSVGTLYKDGGLPRFYRGILPALVQSPLSRFGDTAANQGTLALLNHSQWNNMPIAAKTMLASGAAAGYRAFLMPLDTYKTAKQLYGGEAGTILVDRIKDDGIKCLFSGTTANMSATWLGHYPWFATYNFLEHHLPESAYKSKIQGFVSSCVSDVVSNSMRVVKLTKQISPSSYTYMDCTRLVIEKDGIMGLFTRGLQTRILCNGLQGMVFSVGVKRLMKKMEELDQLKKKRIIE